MTATLHFDDQSLKCMLVNLLTCLYLCYIYACILSRWLWPRWVMTFVLSFLETSKIGEDSWKIKCSWFFKFLNQIKLSNTLLFYLFYVCCLNLRIFSFIYSSVNRIFTSFVKFKVIRAFVCQRDRGPKTQTMPNHRWNYSMERRIKDIFIFSDDAKQF